MRDLLVALFVLGSLPVSFKRPVIGLMVFSLLAYMRIQDLTWGFARFERWSLYVALTMFAGYAFAREKHPPIWNVRTGLLFFLPVWNFTGLVIARGPAYALQSHHIVEYTKIVFIAVFTMMVIRRREHLRAIMWVIGGSFAFFGLKNGLATLASGGSMYIIRGPGGLLEDNNDFALALAMAIPIFVGIATSETNPYYSKTMRLMVPMTLLSVFATRSRGGFLSVVFGTLVMIWRSKNRIMGLGLLGAAGFVGVVGLSSTGIFDRLQTLKNVEEDGSAQGRLRAWAVAWRMVEDKPIFGVGFNQFQRNYQYYGARVNERADGSRVTHNAYLQIWSECGTPAFLSYVGLMILSILAVQRLRRDAKRIYERSWILSYCTAFEAMMLTFMLGSTFLNRAHFDLIYHYFAIIIVFEKVAREEMRNPLQSLSKAGGFGSGQLRLQAQPGFRPATPRRTRGFRSTDLSPVAMRRP